MVTAFSVQLPSVPHLRQKHTEEKKLSDRARFKEYVNEGKSDECLLEHTVVLVERGSEVGRDFLGGFVYVQTAQHRVLPLQHRK